ncbi:Tn3 family transposase [Streptomyces sp. A30]|uniref:Tn3 family transposase n=1 Tax=Streptomyces sp. A30 TaxID=2789273 RepID=UPI00397EF6C1
MEWWRRFGPASGSDPKLKDPFGRYVLTTFVGGIDMTYAEAARHIAGVSAHELGAITNRHLSVDRINEAIADVVNAFMRLDLVKAWGDGTSVAADGTQMDTFIDNLRWTSWRSCVSARRRGGRSPGRTWPRSART